MILNCKSTYITLLLALILFTTNVADGGRRISFGKRLTKPGSKASKPSTVKDTTSEPETVAMDMSMKCGGVGMRLVEEEHLKECASAAGISSKSELSGENVACFVKCLFERTKLVDDNGILQRQNLDNIFATSVSSEVKESLKKIFEKCLDDHGTTMNPSDTSCQSYSPLATCIHSAYADVCRQSM